MLSLDDELLLGLGTLRACYLYPGHPELVIKISLQGKEAGHRANFNEFKSYKQMVAKGRDLSRVSHCHGLVETNLGQGLVCDCIRNEDGRIAPTLWEMVIYDDGLDLPLIKEYVADFCEYLVGEDLFLFDLNLKNIVMQKGAQSQLNVLAIDLKGPYDNREFLKISTYIKPLGRRKLRRRTRQLLSRITEYRNRRQSLRLLDQVIPAKAVL